MKILVAKFTLEANANIPMQCDLKHFSLRYDQDCLKGMQLNGIFEDEGVEVIPVILADAGSSGVLKKRAFDYIEGTILDAVTENMKDLDGIYLHLHGASEVVDLPGGSGEHHIVKEIRKLVGPYLPIAVVCDPHGNLSKEYVENTTIIRSYRESPHIDVAQTVAFVVKELIETIRHPRHIHPVYRKLPMILGGEQSVSADEPVRTINQIMNEMEKDPRILSASWHVGYIRHDTEVAGCGIVVVPSCEEDQAYANEKADWLANFVFEKRHEFHYTGLTASPDEAVQMALAFEGKPVFITDSGDNVTSGSTGANTFVLKQFLAIKDLKKKVLFASIHDDATYARLSACEIGELVQIDLGMNYDELSAPVSLKVKVIMHGQQIGIKMFGEDGSWGNVIKVSVHDYPIDILITDSNHAFVEHAQFIEAQSDWNDYDICVVKIGYAFPQLKEFGKLCVMSLTEGATLQNTAALKFRRIMRPMFPIDQI